MQLQAALRDASERARRASEDAEEAEIVLVHWWSKVIRWVKARQIDWQTGGSFG